MFVRESVNCQECSAIVNLRDKSPFENVLCPECNSPVEVKNSIGDWQLRKSLSQNDLYETFMAESPSAALSVIKVIDKKRKFSKFLGNSMPLWMILMLQSWLADWLWSLESRPFYN